ncbi:hypothetical protein ACFS7Z_14815 [Pontibacter toksunensis]|uniref:Uncharacterized protein n=1 Tax=Pontibacter toksunensis TaxID=1332631 RepID=A0ABW6BWY2_9BACT
MKVNGINILKGIRSGLCIFLMAGMVACGGEEVAEGNMTEEGVEGEEGSQADSEEVVTGTEESNE